MLKDKKMVLYFYEFSKKSFNNKIGLIFMSELKGDKNTLLTLILKKSVLFANTRL